MSKQVHTSMGEIPPRDRDGIFDSQVVRKREKILANSLADRIMSLFPDAEFREYLDENIVVGDFACDGAQVVDDLADVFA